MKSPFDYRAKPLKRAAREELCPFLLRWLLWGRAGWMVAEESMFLD